jgi:ribosomal protein L11 methyltransferase
MTDWIEISLTVDGEGAEAVADLLRRYVSQGVAIERAIPGGEVWPDEPIPDGPMIVRAYLKDDEDSAHNRRKIEEGLYYLSRLYPIPEPSFKTVTEQDWAEAWKRGFAPMRVGRRLLLKPSWIEVEPAPDDIVIDLDPGMAFGTGTHPTTQLCLQACEWFCRPGVNMVDIGTGSGILAIAAAKLGCYRVLARDIDEVAVQAAQQNVIRNGVEQQVIVQHGSIEGLVTSARHFEVGMANITANVITHMTRQGIQHLIWPGGRFVFSGVLKDQAGDVIAALDAADLPLLGARELGDWMLLITQRRIP